MRIGKLIAAAAVASSVVIAGPAMANQAAPLSLAKASGVKAANVKASTTSKKANKLAPEVGVGVALLVVGGAVVALSGDDNDSN